jgi:DNA-binding NtrC family response regulator
MSGSATSGASAALSTGVLDLQALEKKAILQALQKFNNNRSAAAEALGISRRTLQRKLKEYQIAGQDTQDEEHPG